MRKTDVQTTGKGFVVKKSQEAIEKEARETRIQEQRENPKANPSLKDIYQLQLDIVARQSEIYEMLKKISTQ